MYSEMKAYMCLMCFRHVSVVVCVMFLDDAAVVFRESSSVRQHDHHRVVSQPRALPSTTTTFRIINGDEQRNKSPACIFLSTFVVISAMLTSSKFVVVVYR